MTQYYAPSELPPGTLRLFHEEHEGLTHVAKYYTRDPGWATNAEWREVCTSRLSPFAANRKRPDSPGPPTCLWCVALAFSGNVASYSEERPWRRAL